MERCEGIRESVMALVMITALMYEKHFQCKLFAVQWVEFVSDILVAM